MWPCGEAMLNPLRNKNLITWDDRCQGDWPLAPTRHRFLNLIEFNILRIVNSIKPNSFLWAVPHRRATHKRCCRVLLGVGAA
jgi:hypothetical protein